MGVPGPAGAENPFAAAQFASPGLAAAPVGPPSQAAVVLGWLAVAYGVYSAIGGLVAAAVLGLDPGGEASETTANLAALAIISGLGSLIVAAAMITGGWLMTQYQRFGVHLVWVALVLDVIVDAIAFSFLGDALALDSGIESTTLSTLVIVGATAMQNAVCGVIIAIPLFSADGGLQ